MIPGCVKHRMGLDQDVMLAQGLATIWRSVLCLSRVSDGEKFDLNKAFGSACNEEREKKGGRSGRRGREEGREKGKGRDGERVGEKEGGKKTNREEEREEEEGERGREYEAFGENLSAEGAGGHGHLGMPEARVSALKTDLGNWEIRFS